MNPSRWHRLKLASSLTGAFVFFMPNSVTWYWGNVVVYTDSYFRDADGSEEAVKSTWLISSFIIMWTLGLMMSDKFIRLTGRRTALLIVIIMFDGAMFASYLAVQHSMLTLTLTLGVTCGFANGLGYAQILAVVFTWLDRRVGMATAAVTSSFAAGSLLVNQFVTRYINPDNLVPDVVRGPRKYFDQKQILDKVPGIFIVLGIYSLSMHSVAFLLTQ